MPLRLDYRTFDRRQPVLDLVQSPRFRDPDDIGFDPTFGGWYWGLDGRQLPASERLGHGDVWIKSRGHRLPDFLRVTTRWAVCREFRAIVEELEPGVHDFLPLRIVRWSGKQRPAFTRWDRRPYEDGDFHLFACRHVLMPIVAGQSDVEERRQSFSRYPQYVTTKQEARVVLDRAIVGTAAAWCCPRYYFNDAAGLGNLWISDELEARLLAAGVSFATLKITRFGLG